MKITSSVVLRLGLGITFLWIGILIYQQPEVWGGYIRPWAANLLTVPLRQAMLSTAILDMVVGVMLLAGVWVWVAALLAAGHLVIVLVTSGIGDVTIRDVGLLTAALALMIENLPVWVTNRLTFLRK